MNRDEQTGTGNIDRGIDCKGNRFLCHSYVFGQFVPTVVQCLYRYFTGRMLGQMIHIGLPTGMQNSIISLANVVVQSNINSFGEMAMAVTKHCHFAIFPLGQFSPSEELQLSSHQAFF